MRRPSQFDVEFGFEMPLSAAPTGIETAFRNAIVSDSLAQANLLPGRYVAAVEGLPRSQPPGASTL
jgi:hypothetical protein